MGSTSGNKPKKHICIGLLAHVDAGKTTFSEGLLYRSGRIRKMGRVDNGDAYLDTDALEKARGITIFSKQAVFDYGNLSITLLDTPGHVDFSAEMERTLQVLDYAILVISGADGVQGHTKTLWGLLKRYRVPVFLFINKMDQLEPDLEMHRKALMADLKNQLSESCICFSEDETEAFFEEIAMEEEEAMEAFIENGRLETDNIKRMISGRQIFPCYFGSALKLQGVDEFLQGMEQYMTAPSYGKEFGAKVFKIARDEQGKRLTYLKVTGGHLKLKDVMEGQKVNQIRLYSGSRYEMVSEAEAGTVCAAVGLENTHPGQGIGIEKMSALPLLEPVLNYRMILPEGTDVAFILPKLRQLEEEEPQLHILWKEELQEIHVQMMGEVQIEILQSLILKRFGVEAAFGTGTIVYKETIANIVEGVGHFEPLRHYAEVHLLLEPAESGSGMQFATDCSEDELGKNWQRLVLTHLEEKEHVGVLTGAKITDIKITLIAGRAHLKHTEGGDFRQATYRAVRQGLMQAESVLLEPYYDFRLELPQHLVGRAMTDIEKMYGSVTGPFPEGSVSVLTGSAPVSCMQNYQKDVTAYSKGEGKLFLTLGGYRPCHNAEEVIQASGYDAEHDLLHPSGSVFCAHGAGFVVEWDQVKDYMHVEGRLLGAGQKKEGETCFPARKRPDEEARREAIGTEEIEAILAKTYQANAHKKGEVKRWGTRRNAEKKVIANDAEKPLVRNKTKEEYLLVDGYNIIFAWENLRALAAENIDGARGHLLDILCNYQGIKKCSLIVVFDAYRVLGHKTEILDYHNIHVVYTKEAETADAYIEKFAHENGRKYQVTVATSDGLEQMIIMGQGCLLLSAKELREEIERAAAAVKDAMQERKENIHHYVLDAASEEVKNQIRKACSKSKKDF